jgi:hypothetical protein
MNLVGTRQRKLARRAGIAVIAGAALLLISQVLAVVEFSTPCSQTAAACTGIGGHQTWWGLSTTNQTWYSGDINYWAISFLVAALASSAWGIAALLSRGQNGLLATAALIAALVVGALAANLVRLYQFTSYWVHQSCLSGNCSVSTHSDIGLGCTIVDSVFLVLALVLASGLLYTKREGVTGGGSETSQTGLEAKPGAGAR